MMTVGKLKKALEGYHDSKMIYVVRRNNGGFMIPQGEAIASGSIFVGSDEISFGAVPCPDRSETTWLAHKIIYEKL
jgi:hypothetical protein